MLVDNQCSIYEHRPQACRTYDCRVFPAAGVEIDDDGKALIAQRARRWRFGFPTQADRNQHAAVRAAAKFLHDHADLLADVAEPANATQLAVLAIEIHDAFLRRDEDTGDTTVADPDAEVVRAEVTRRTRPRDP
ncbi:MAG: uncharacterized protein QOI55_2419 [Actinomycetota bacterium]|nr:uncharacterized protein [Actinomycetota bacterium]